MIFDAQNHGMPDPFSKNSSRFLYIKHLETNITEEELKGRYGKYGHILVGIRNFKKRGKNIPCNTGKF
jgi:hypothetical protein